jgi:hypothetical protein
MTCRMPDSGFWMLDAGCSGILEIQYLVIFDKIFKITPNTEDRRLCSQTA